MKQKDEKNNVINLAEYRAKKQKIEKNINVDNNLNVDSLCLGKTMFARALAEKLNIPLIDNGLMKNAASTPINECAIEEINAIKQFKEALKELDEYLFDFDKG